MVDLGCMDFNGDGEEELGGFYEAFLFKNQVSRCLFIFLVLSFVSVCCFVIRFSLLVVTFFLLSVFL